jgi:hypothetical protein
MDIVDRLRYGDPMLCARQAADELENLHDLLGKANALARIRWGEIERLKAERDAAIKEVGKWSREAGVSQAREAKLRELLAQFELWESYDDPETPIKDALARIGSDDTALKEAIKQAKREALLEAADFLFSDGQHNHWAVKELRRMAEEL